ncbi:hypothetical protein SAMN06265173_10660 [Thalassovita litoralis]|jgi:hypothetical protein|uniref:Uncharacterized protein n=1 Tax=Thalassovita litoralis TaxID=1010611 RepID=A0A521CCX3_9RHOB|nr:hypothetical protein SAMN06265173_10660 [Thalassovita litoralis]
MSAQLVFWAGEKFRYGILNGKFAIFRASGGSIFCKMKGVGA